MVLGFLLLLPLQEFASWRGLSQGLQQDYARRADAERRSIAMLQAIQVATSVDDLQFRMQRLQGPTFTPRRSRPASAPAAGSALRSFTPAAVDAHPVLRRMLIGGGFVELPIEAAHGLAVVQLPPPCTAIPSIACCWPRRSAKGCC